MYLPSDRISHFRRPSNIRSESIACQKGKSKKNLKKEKYECAYMDNEGDLQESYRADYSSVELAFDLKNITLKMTSNQRDILKYLILGWSDSEIASFLHFSRQYVNREKKKYINF